MCVYSYIYRNVCVMFTTVNIVLLGPTMEKLCEFVVPQITASWEDVAYTALHYDIPIVENIKQQYKNDIKGSCREMFKIWLTTEHGRKPKTWSTLLVQLEKVDGLTVAIERIKEKLSTCDNT